MVLLKDGNLRKSDNESPKMNSKEQLKIEYKLEHPLIRIIPSFCKENFFANIKTFADFCQKVQDADNGKDSKQINVYLITFKNSIKASARKH